MMCKKKQNTGTNELSEPHIHLTRCDRSRRPWTVVQLFERLT